MDRVDNEGVSSGSDEGEGNGPKENINISSAIREQRAQRNTLERKRKGKIRMYISQLHEMIPKDFMPLSSKKVSSNNLLEQAVSYMRHLKVQTDAFMTKDGTEILSAEITRLRSDLMAVTLERDKYEKMVLQAAAVTPKMIAQVSNKGLVGHHIPLQPGHSETRIQSNAPSSIPGQGLVIMKNSGEAFFSNEQGIPVAQVMGGTPQILTDHMLVNSNAMQLSSVANLVSQTLAVSTNAVTSPASLTPAISTDIPLTNSLVSGPGQASHLSGAILLPQKQTIPVATSGSPAVTLMNLINTAVTTSGTLSSTANSSADLTYSSSNSSTPANSGIMFMGGQPPMVSSGTVLQPQPITGVLQSQPVDPSANQFGRKIMPKPMTQPMFSQLPAGMITLAPLPHPLSSISIAPTSTFNPDINLQPRKKRTRKKKVDKDCVEPVPPTNAPTAQPPQDLLATATANLFSPVKPSQPSPPQQEQAPNSNELASRSISGSVESRIPAFSPAFIPSTGAVFMPSNNAAFITAPTAPLPGVPTTLPLNGTRARRTRKRKDKAMKKAEAESNPKSAKGPKKPKISYEDVTPPPTGVSEPINLMDETAVTLPPAEVGDTECGSVCNIESQVPTQQQPAATIASIEFDPNDLDNILDQVENIESGKSTQEPAAVTSVVVAAAVTDSTGDYQLISDNEEIGHVFTTERKGAAGGEAENPVVNENVVPATDSLVNRSSVTSFNSSESYLIGNLTKTSEQPVDHRQQAGNHKSSLTRNSSMASIQDAYSTPVVPQHRANEDEKPAPAIKPTTHNMATYNTASIKPSTQHEHQSPNETAQFQTWSKSNNQTDVSSGSVTQSINESLTHSRHQSSTPGGESPANSQRSSNLSNLSNPTYSDSGRFSIESSTHIEQSPYTECSKPQTLPTANQTPVIHSTPASVNISSAAWSPAKDAEWLSRTSQPRQTNTQYHNPNMNSQHSYPSQQSLPKEPSSVSPRMQFSKSSTGSRQQFNNPSASPQHQQPYKDPVKSFQDSPYQYTQFSAFSNGMNIPPLSHRHEMPVEASKESNPNGFPNYNTAGRRLSQEPHGSPVWQPLAANNDRSAPPPVSYSQKLQHPEAERSESQVPQPPPKPVTSLKKKPVKPKPRMSKPRDVQDSKAHRHPVHFPQHAPPSNNLHQSQPTDNVYQPMNSLPYYYPGGTTPKPFVPPPASVPHINDHHVSDGRGQTSTSDVFSTQSLLSRDNTRALKESPQLPAQQHYPAPQNLSSHNMLDKDRSFMSSQANSTPFNVNMFTPSTAGSSALSQTPIRSSIPSSVGLSSFSDSSFTFSLTGTSSGLPITSSASYSNKTNYTAPGQIPFLLPPAAHHLSIGGIEDRADRSSSSANRMNSSSATQLPTQSNTAAPTGYMPEFNNRLSHLYPDKPNSQSSSQTPANNPALVKAKRTKPQPAAEALKDFPALPYGFPHQSYAIPQFSANRNGEVAPPSNIFDPQSMYNKPSGSLGIPFQHAGFPALPSRSSAGFNPHQTAINQTPSFLNNFFKEAPPMEAAFKLGSNPSHVSMYNPARPSLYHNPMSINNILGSSSGFDPNRPPTSVGSFPGGHPGFTGFPHPFDFNVSNQS